MQTFYLVAAHTHPPLEELVKEIRDIQNISRSLEERKVWNVIPNRAADLSDIFSIFSKNSSEIKIFHYSGHSDQNELKLPEGGHIRGVAGLFGLSEPDEKGKNPLNLVFLNGCSSRGMVKALHDAGVGAVIATSCRIGDKLARDFATHFYQAWTKEGNKLGKALEIASAYIQSISGEKYSHIQVRDAIGFYSEIDIQEDFPWGLYTNYQFSLADREKILNWEINPPPIIKHNTFSALNNSSDFDLHTGHFVGREELLDTIKSNFKNGKRIQVLYGMDGNGKTRLASRYCNNLEQQGEYSKLIWWFHARIPELIENEMNQLATKLFPEYVAIDFREAKEMLLDWFRKNSDWILVFDDARDEQAIADYLPEGNGHILITSSNKSWHSGLPNIELCEVPCLDRDSATLLLLKRTAGKLSAEKAKEWAVNLEGYPIVLEMLADFFMDGSQSEEQFSSAFLSDFVKEHDNQKRFENLVNSVFDYLPKDKMRGLASKYGFSVSYFLLSWLNSRRIPNYLFTQLIEQTRESMRMEGKPVFITSWLNKQIAKAKVKAEVALARTQSALLRKSVIFEVEGKYISINTFVQDVFFSRSLNIPPFFFKYSLGNISDLLSDELYEASKLEDIKERKLKQELLLPHAVSLLNNARANNREIIAMARLARRLGKIFLSEGQYIQSKNYTKYAYDLELRFKGKATSWTLDNLMESTLFTGEFNLFKEVLSQRKKIDDFSLSEALLTEGLGFLAYGNDEKALKLIEDSIMAARNIISENSNIGIVYSLAALVSASIDPPKCINYLNMGESAIINEHTKDSEEYAKYLWISAAAHYKMPFNQYDSDDTKHDSTLFFAYQLYEECHELLLRFKEPTHPIVVGFLVEKALCTIALGEIEKTEEICETITQNKEVIIKSWGENSAILANYELVRAEIEYLKENEETRKFHLKKARSILMEYFKGDKTQNQIVQIGKILNELD